MTLFIDANSRPGPSDGYHIGDRGLTRPSTLSGSFQRFLEDTGFWAPGTFAEFSNTSQHPGTYFYDQERDPVQSDFVLLFGDISAIHRSSRTVYSDNNKNALDHLGTVLQVLSDVRFGVPSLTRRAAT